jgi:hypothetical protein
MKKAIHFRGLNGIRAFAASAVLIAHIMADLSDFGLNYLADSFNYFEKKFIKMKGKYTSVKSKA